jgi:hypothetical protein
VGFLDRLLGRTKDVAGDATETAGDVAEKGMDVAGDAVDEGKDLAEEGLDKVRGEDRPETPSGGSGTSPTP